MLLGPLCLAVQDPCRDGEHALIEDALAERFAEGLGRPIRSAPLPLADFERGVDTAVGPRAGARIGAI